MTPGLLDDEVIMKCPSCGKIQTEVKDSRVVNDGAVVRRRRVCSKCHNRFSTIERIYLREIFVVKRSGVVKKFDPEKISKSLSTALRKRPIPEKIITQLVDNIVNKIENDPQKQIPSRRIGEMIMQELFNVDLVAYIRFASVYKDFSSAEDFAKFVNDLSKK
jgi:transcriptional repressor NrdR